MKTLELNLNKRLLIVEYDDYIIKKYDLKGYADKVLNSVEIENQLSELTGGDQSLRHNLICIGPEHSEDIAKGFFEYDGIFEAYQYYHDTLPIMGNTALNLFNTAVKNHGQLEMNFIKLRISLKEKMNINALNPGPSTQIDV